MCVFRIPYIDHHINYIIVGVPTRSSGIHAGVRDGIIQCRGVLLKQDSC